MENRRAFIKKCLAGGLVISLPGMTAAAGVTPINTNMTKTFPEKALVIYYSQTGHTERIGKLICDVWRKAGVSVDCSEYRELNNTEWEQYDLIVMGTPVQYMDVPVNLQQWIHSLPKLRETPVASFVTYGGHGDGQHNTACSLLQNMAEKGGVPIGIGLFGNMSTFAPTWSLGNARRILAFKDRPNEKTYEQARTFANALLNRSSSSRPYKINRQFGMDSLMRIFPQISMTKLMITAHYIDKNICIECGVCLNKCPTGAISPKQGAVDSTVCLACLGCVNNCPVQAVHMNFFGKKVYGFNAFLKRNDITITEPDELKA